MMEIASKIEKGKPGEMDLPLLENDITGSEPTVKILDTLQVSVITIKSPAGVKRIETLVR